MLLPILAGHTHTRVRGAVSDSGERKLIVETHYQSIRILVTWESSTVPLSTYIHLNIYPSALNSTAKRHWGAPLP